jgi:predicted  nucleic acid-binding Zn-ribbon protein
MRKEITEEQITNLMQAIPRAEEVDRLREDNERLTRHVALVSERVRHLSDERDYAWGQVEKLRADYERLTLQLDKAWAEIEAAGLAVVEREDGR